MIHDTGDHTNRQQPQGGVEFEAHHQHDHHSTHRTQYRMQFETDRHWQASCQWHPNPNIEFNPHV